MLGFKPVDMYVCKEGDDVVGLNNQLLLNQKRKKLEQQNLQQAPNQHKPLEQQKPTATTNNQQQEENCSKKQTKQNKTKPVNPTEKKYKTADPNETHQPTQSGTGSTINLHPTFTHQNPRGCPGTVEVKVGNTTFLVHKQLMIHASPFFESILTGEWAETTELNTSSSPSPSASSASSTQEQSTHQPQLDQLLEQHHIYSTTTTTNDQLSDFSSTTNDDPSTQLEDEPATLSSALSHPLTLLKPSIPNASNANRIEARILLKEERPASFQDLLMFVYPHLECVCTWHNASDLMTMSQKFDMPLLQRHVLNFLLSSVAGKPIEAMKIAEEHQLSELYRESSRFLLDNWQGWDHKELERLSSQTLLKLEKRRTWFLERLLKLGLVNSSRDYVCPPSCPDPQHCTKLVDDKWRSAWAASFKFGPPQPSSVYRALRCLEPSLHSPALLLPHTSCQQHALRFFADLFDRMFSQFTPRGPGGGGPGGGGGGAVGANGTATGIGAVAVSQTGSTSSTANPLMGSVEATQPPPGLPYYLASSVGTPVPSIPSSSNTTHNSTGLNLASTGLTTPNNNNTHHPVATGSSTTTTTTAGGGSGGLHLTTGTISASSHPLLLLQNSEKNFRKAKYFLHVELFESVEKNRKRLD